MKKLSEEERKKNRELSIKKWNSSSGAREATERYRKSLPEEVFKVGGWVYEAKRKRLRNSEKYATNRRQVYPAWAEDLILRHEIPDSEIAILLGRSLKAIERKRASLLGKP